jgi:hypothetical protein
MNWVRAIGDGIWDHGRFRGKIGRVNPDYSDPWAGEYIVEFAPGARDLVHYSHPFAGLWDRFYTKDLEALDGDVEDEYTCQWLAMILEDT